MIVKGELRYYTPLDQKTVDKLKRQERVEVEDLELTVGCFNSLKRRGIHFLDELLEVRLEKLRNTAGFGPSRTEEIRRRVGELGYEMVE